VCPRCKQALDVPGDPESLKGHAVHRVYAVEGRPIMPGGRGNHRWLTPPTLHAANAVLHSPSLRTATFSSADLRPFYNLEHSWLDVHFGTPAGAALSATRHFVALLASGFTKGHLGETLIPSGLLATSDIYKC